MAALPDLPRTLAKNIPGLGFAAAAACALTGCGADYASSDPAFPGDFQERHPIVLASAPTTLDIYPVGGAPRRAFLGEPARVRRPVSALRRRGNHDLYSGAGDADREGGLRDSEDPLAGAGMRGMVGVGSYAPLNLDRAAPIRVAFIGLKAQVSSPCGLWPDDLASGSSVSGWKNEPYANFGCATQATLAAQVDDPRDFVQSRALAPSDVAMRTRAIENVRKGQDPGTTWTTGLTPIGTISGGQ